MTDDEFRKQEAFEIEWYEKNVQDVKIRKVRQRISRYIRLGYSYKDLTWELFNDDQLWEKVKDMATGDDPRCFDRSKRKLDEMMESMMESGMSMEEIVKEFRKEGSELRKFPKEPRHNIQ